jgi:hypothetical protein
MENHILQGSYFKFFLSRSVLSMMKFVYDAQYFLKMFLNISVVTFVLKQHHETIGYFRKILTN